MAEAVYGLSVTVGESGRDDVDDDTRGVDGWLVLSSVSGSGSASSSISDFDAAAEDNEVVDEAADEGSLGGGAS
jgi:hypothetical protein